MERGIWVTGSGSATGPFDECAISVGAEVRAATAGAALAGCGDALARMRAALVAAGVAESALATSAVSLNPVYDQYPVVAGFQAAIGLSATTRDFEGSGALISAVVDAGGEAARVHNVSFGHADATGLVSRARDEAWADARARAEQLAALAGRELGEVLAIDERAGRSSPPGPLRMAAMADAGGMGKVALDAGEGAVVVTLTVGWALR